MYMYMIVIYMVFMSIMLFMLFMYFYLYNLVMYLEFMLISIQSVNMNVLIFVDWIFLVFSGVVLMISSMVMIYSVEYMDLDSKKDQFNFMIILFVISMLLLIVSPNMISVMLGWDGLGLVSYCLVIYYQSKNSFNSGMVTVLINRVGDVLILISIGMMISKGSWNFMFFNEVSDLMLLLIIMASMTKSAQLPFSSWLPMAMAAPTPVSSLVHSSTLVTAGVYMLIRFLYLMDEMLMNFMFLISLMTMFMSGLSANFEYDFKKIIALSTLSQLGVMFFCLSMNMEELVLFHLMIHAMFKSMLFMCSGVIIHNMGNNQDIRYISLIIYNLPLISLFFNCSVMSLCGIPFMSGFYSKDLILEMYLMHKFNKFIMIMLFTSMGLTLMYSMRLIYYTFVKVPMLVVFNLYYSYSSMMGVSMFLLFFFSIIKGSMLSWILFSSSMVYLMLNFKLLIYYFMMMVLGMEILMNMFMNRVNLIKFNRFMKFLKYLWLMPLLYGGSIWMILNFSNKIIFKVESGWLEYSLVISMMSLFNQFFKIELVNKNYFYLLVFIMSFIYLMIF